MSNKLLVSVAVVVVAIAFAVGGFVVGGSLIQSNKSITSPLGNIPNNSQIINITLKGMVVRKEGARLTFVSNSQTQTFTATPQIQVFAKPGSKNPTAASGSASIPVNQSLQIILIPVGSEYQVSAVLIQ